MPDSQTSQVKQKSSIIRKLTIIFFVLITPFFIFGVLMLYFFKFELDEYFIEFQKYKVVEEAEVIDDFIGKTVDDLKSFYILKDDIGKNNFSLTTSHIYQLFLVNKGVKEVKIIDPSGNEAVSISRVGIAPRESLKNVGEELFFKTAKLDKIFISGAYLDNKTTYIDMAVPYFENFRLIGVVYAKISFEELFSDITSEFGFGNGHTHILDKNGVILGAADSALIGKDVSSTGLFSRLKAGEKNIIGIECRPCVEEHEFDIIASAWRIKNPLGFLVVLESNKDLVYSGFYTVRNIFIGGTFWTWIVSIVLILLVNSRIKKYFGILVKGIENFHQGKFDEKIVLKTGDEVEYFVEHFNHLVSELGQTIKKLKQVDIVKYNFTTNISHQLRTPISSIMWLVETLSSQIGGGLTKEQRAIFQDVHKAARNIAQIINDMILMVDVDDNKVALDKSSANCDDIIDSAMLAVQDQAREKNIAVEYQKPETPLPDRKGDVQKLKFVFTRLLDNAIKYSDKGKTIIVTARSLKDEIVFSVQDWGVGIPQAEQPRIFTKFYRASNAYKMLQDASGLSLYIAKYFIELHGGRIWFDSKEGEGTTFYFSLPIK